MKHLIITLLSVILLTGCEQQVVQNHAEDQSQPLSNNESSSQFLWDFEKPKTIVYNYTQNVANEFIIGKDEDSKEMGTKAVGQLKVVVNESKMADLNLRVSMTMVTPDGGQTTEREGPPLFVQDMAADGSIDDNNSETIFKFIFPLPPRFLNIGETTSIPMKMPLRASGTVLYTKGSLNLTYVRDTVLFERNCAILEGVIDISDTKVPDGMNVKVDGGTTGWGKYYFDLKDGLFVKVAVEMTMEYKIETVASGEMFDGNSYMKNFNVFDIVLEEIED